MSDRVTDALTPAEAAVRLKVSERTIWRRIKAGKLQTEHTPEGVRVVLTDAVSVDDRHLTDATDRVSDTMTDTMSDAPEGKLERAFELIEQIHEDHRRELDQVREDRQQTIDQLRQENERLVRDKEAARQAAEHWQARFFEEQEKVLRLLPAPKDEPEPAVQPERVSWWKRFFS